MKFELGGKIDLNVLGMDELLKIGRQVIVQNVQIVSLLSRVLKMEEAQMAKVDDLISEVASDTDAVSSLENVIDTLIATVEANKTDPAKLQQVLDGMKSNRDRIVQATLKGTPADPNA